MSALSDLITAEGAALATAPITKTELLLAIKELAEMATSSGLTRAECIATTFANPPASIRTIGYYTPGDYGAGLYVKKTTQPDHKGKFQTGDGTWYELVPEGGQVFVEQFGAQNVVGWNDTTPDAAPGCNDAVDYIVFSGWGACDMRFGAGVKYLGSSIHLKGASFNVKGLATWGDANGSSYLRPAVGVDGFIGHHPQWSFEKDGNVYYNGRQCEVGEKCYFQDPGTAGQVTHSYIVASVTGTATRETNFNTTVPVGFTASSGSGPTGTSNGQVDGSVVWNYYRETTRVERSNTYYNGCISDLVIYSHWDRASQPYGTANAIFSRARIHVRNCWIGNMSMHAICIVANGDPENPWASGNVNGWRVETCSLYWCGMDGLHIGYSNSNAGTSMHLDLGENGRWGIADWSFLGDSHYASQDAYSGVTSFGVSKKHHACTHNGALWYAMLPAIGVQNWSDWNTVEPGTNAGVWYCYYTDPGHTVAPGGNFPDWETTRVPNPTFLAFNQGGFEPGGPYSGNNVNARNRWDGMYIEGSDAQAQWGPRDLITGGLINSMWLVGKGTVIYDGTWYGNFNSYTQGQFDYASGTLKTWQISFGGSDGYQNTGIFNWWDGGFNSSLSFAGRNSTNSDRDIVLCRNSDIVGGFNWNTPFRLCTGSSSYSAGKVDNSANPVAVGQGALALKYLCVGSGGESSQRQIDIGNSSVKTSGYHGRGEIIFNIDAAVGSPMGWMCVTAGNPGTWATMPNLV